MKHLMFIIALLLVGCMDQDPFGLSTRDIRGSYELEQWEDGITYYLRGPSHLEGGWGALEGMVEKIGWSDDYIFAFQTDCGSGSGWRIIDVKEGTVSEIKNYFEIEKVLESTGIDVHSPSTAWVKLK